MSEEKPKPEGYVFGRPTKYRAEFCERAVALGAEGMSRAEIAADFRVAKSTIQEWELHHPDFSAAMAYAKTLEQSWWERKGRLNLEAQHFQASMWSRSMGARFPDDWRETSRQEHAGHDGKSVKVEAEGALAEFLGRISRINARAAEDVDPGSVEGS